METTQEDLIRGLLVETPESKHGVQILLNCQFNEASEIFSESKSDYPCAAAGYCLMNILRFVTSFEEDHKRQALEAVRQVEHDCVHEQGQFRKNLRKLTQNDIFRQLSAYHLDVVCADCYLYQAVAIMMNMEMASYVKGGWYVRKAWKLYEKLHRETERLMNLYSIQLNELNAADDDDSNDLDRDTLIRNLFCTVSFGYGLFNLFLSILSPQILKLTVARSFLALDGSTANCGVAEAERLLSRQSEQLANTMLFVFFKGRIKRIQSDAPRAIAYYEEALKAAGNQAELQQMCQYELGWCGLHLLQWAQAGSYFKTLQERSKWLPSYYCYLAGLCCGASDDLETSKTLLTLVGKLTKRKNNPIEIFVTYRAKKLSSNDYEINKRHCILFLVETMFFWRALPNVSSDELEILLIEMNKVNDKRLISLKCLLEGAIYAIMDRNDLAVQYLDESIARSDRTKEEKHWVAFASFELAYILMKNQNTRERAKTLLLQVRDKMRGYFFENRLHLRLHAALKMLDKLEKAEK